MPTLGTMTTVVLVLAGIGFVGFGLAYLAWPDRMAALTDIALPSESARIDLRATYGGFQLGFGGFLLAAARESSWRLPGLWAATAALAGFATVRGLGIVANRGRVRGTIWVGWGLELIALALAGWALDQAR